jgi:hypothetical protein
VLAAVLVAVERIVGQRERQWVRAGMKGTRRRRRTRRRRTTRRANAKQPRLCS